MFPAQNFFILRAQQNIRNVTGAELFFGALDTRKELLREDRDISQGSGSGGAVVAVGAGFSYVGFAEVLEKRLAAAGPFIFRILHDRIQMLHGNALLTTFFLINKIGELGNVSVTVKQDAVRLQTVAPGTSDFLVVTLDTFGQVEVNDKTDIRLVDAHPKCDRGNDDLGIIADKGFLIHSPLRVFQASMIRADGISPGGKIRGKFIHLLP